jgi:O-antigen ligase
MVQSRFNIKIPFFLFIAVLISMMISLFLLELFTASLVFIWLFEKWEDKKKAADIYLYLILAFGFVRILSIIFSQYPSQSVQSFYKDALFYLGFFAMSFYLRTFTKKQVLYIVYSFLLGAVMVSIIGLVLFNLSRFDRAQSFTTGYATFSSYLLTALGVYIVFDFEELSKYKTAIIVIGISLVLSGIITSLGRWNIAVAGAVIVIGLIIKKITIKNAALIIVLTALISAFSFHNNNVEVDRRVENISTLSDRNILIKGAETLLWQHPIVGFGPRTFHQIFPYYNELGDKGVGSWHDDFIQMYFESGILGLAAFLCLIIYTLFIPLKTLLKEKPEEYYRKIIIGIFLGIGALVLSGLLAGFIDSPVLSVLFAFLIALESSALFHNRKDKEISA